MPRKIETLYKRMGINIKNRKAVFGKGEFVENLYGQKLKPYNIPEYNLKKIYEFDSLLQAKGRKYYSRIHYLYPLAHLCHRIHKPLEKMTEQDLIGFVKSWIMDETRFKTPSTRNTYKRAIKSFFKWCQGRKKHFPECVEFIEYEKVDKTVTESDLLTKEEIKRMMDAANNPQHRAIVITLFESSFRRSELISCHIKDLKFYPEGYAILTVPEKSVSETGIAKTGSYSATLIESVPFLKAHLNHHSDRDNKNAPLFYSMKHQEYGKPLEGEGLYQVIKTLSKRAGIEGKRVYTHLFRHSISTVWAREGYTDREINIMSGRKPNSRVADVYINLTGGDVRKKVLRKKGLISPEETDSFSIAKVKCWNCGTENPANNLICLNNECNMPLRIDPKHKDRYQKVADAMLFSSTIEKLKKRPKLYSEFIGSLKRIEKALKKMKGVLICS